jgi:hypothetical protein
LNNLDERFDQYHPPRYSHLARNQNVMMGPRKMPLRSIGQGWIGWLVTAATLTMAPAAQATALDLFYERTVMSVADHRCNLFAPKVTVALDAARLQARGAALRAGVDQDVIKETARQATLRSNSVACGSSDLLVAANRVKSAFAAYSRLTRMDFPGDTAGWAASRGQAVHTANWQLYQTARFGWDSMTFGIASRSGSSGLVAAASFADGAIPYGARIMMRDLSKAPRPYLNLRVADQNGKVPLHARAAPLSVSRAILAEDRSDADSTLLPAKAKSGIAFRWPPAAAAAMAELDPREAVRVEFLFAGRNGDTLRTAYIEVGDFAAGRAFLASGQQ